MKVLSSVAIAIDAMLVVTIVALAALTATVIWVNRLAYRKVRPLQSPPDVRYLPAPNTYRRRRSDLT